MGAWGLGIFENDATLDLRGDFDDLLTEGLTVPAATARLWADYAEALNDDDDGPVLRIALAALQLEHGALEPWFRDEAEAANARDGENSWCRTTDEEIAKRAEMLEELRQRMALALG